MKYETFRGIVERIRTEEYDINDFDSSILEETYVYGKIGRLREDDRETAETYAHFILSSYIAGFNRSTAKTLGDRVVPSAVEHLVVTSIREERRTAGKGEDAD